MATTNTLYATIDDLRDHLRISDATDDPRLLSVLTATCRSIDRYCGQVFSSDDAATARVYSPYRPDRLWTHPFHTTTGLVVETDTSDDGTFDTTWTVTTEYVAGPESGYDQAGFAVPYNRIEAVGSRRFPIDRRRARTRVTAQWGWTAVPDAVREATLIKAARVFRRRDTPEGLAGGGEFGVVRVSSREDPDVVMLLAPFCTPSAVPVVA